MWKCQEWGSEGSRHVLGNRNGNYENSRGMWEAGDGVRGGRTMESMRRLGLGVQRNGGGWGGKDL